MSVDALGRRLVDVALLEGDFLLRSGKRSRFYLDKYRFETDRFINPGEDFTPEPPKAAPPRPIGNTL